MPIQRRPKPTSPDEFIEGANLTESVLQHQIEVLEHQLQQKDEHEQALVGEIEQLRANDLDETERQLLQKQIDELREHLKQNQGSVEYPIAKIHPNPKQTRQTFKEEVEAMERSLQEEGQLDDVMLFDDGTLFDGECRWRAATNLNWKTIRAVFVSRPENDQTLRRRTYLANRHRRDLNALDKAASLVAIVCDEISELKPDEVSRIVNRVLTRLKRRKQKLGDRLHLQPQEQQRAILAQFKLEPVEIQVFLILLGLQEHPATLNRNVFPTLSLNPNLRIAVRERALGCAQALVLNRLTSDNLGLSKQKALQLLNEGIEVTLANNLSEIKAQQWVAEQKKQLVGDATKALSNGVRNQHVDHILVAVQRLDLDKATISTEQRQELKQALKRVLQML
ncbi:ParB N-terminal domain-containing protein (plasmid) [Phormidium sp. CLA17]|uniref:ParB/RepB/Spo0J family partition protein n=1 Tax=Leptolyngbya sp. Cla-17 TaxID=2803751 RepID=UPI001491173D|nr:ParB N-terminal domain-containing protein [Leptolyngbya sp. Cla-17]MBM0745523.1 ParB N-terminal domain-containing protein [Leptolyngbya sp. Cla-17]